MNDSSHFAALLLRVARHLRLSVRPSGHDAQEWHLSTPDGDDGTIVRLGRAGDVTLLRPFSPFDPEQEAQVGFAERRQFAVRVTGVARTIDPDIEVEWRHADLTAILQRRLEPGWAGEGALRDALDALQDVVETSRDEASAVVQGVADDVPEVVAPQVRRTHSAPGTGAVEAQAGLRPKSQLLPAILTTVFCCMPLGIVSIIFAARAESLSNKGDFEAAARSAATARTLWIVSMVLVIVGVLMSFCAAALDAGF